MNRLLIMAMMSVGAGVGVSCGNSLYDKVMNKENNNPLLSEWNTPFEVPPFEKIKSEHFVYAFKKAIEEQNVEIENIVKNKKSANFSNTIEALENSGEKLKRITKLFYCLLGANTNAEMQSIAKEIAPLTSAHQDGIYMNEVLFARIKEVYNQNDNLTKEQTTLLEKTYKNFVRQGASLSAEDKKILKEINAKLAVLSLQFADNVLAETNDYKLNIVDKQKLKGLPQNLLDAAKVEAQNAGYQGWLFTLHNASVMPFLQYADDRELRKTIWEAFANRGSNGNENDNRGIVAQIIRYRHQKAKMLGYDNFAEYSLEETMAKSSKQVFPLLIKLYKPAIKKAAEEEAMIAQMMEEEGIKDGVKPYDWRYYAEKIRKKKYNFDEQELKPYFSIDNVRNGIFITVKKLWGLTFKQRNDIPVYHSEVTTWEVFDKDNTTLGLLYMDMHPRASKKGGAWMTSFRSQGYDDKGRILPIISIVCNFSKPTQDAPALLTFDEVTTYFHEFGHALHGLLSNVKYSSLSGTNVPRDFVELPSQILENWASEPEVLALYAKHYQTGEVIPQEMITKMQNAAKFNQGFATTEYLAASLLDMMYHLEESEINDVNYLEEMYMKDIELIESIIPRYKSTYFSHIFSGGYAAGYYSYIWSEMLDADAFEVFKTKGLFNTEEAESFRKNILEKGGTEDPAELYQKFRGEGISLYPLLKRRGLE